MSLSAVILAGGKSSRMQQDKALLPFGNYSTLTEYQYRKLKSIFNKVYISSKDNKFPFNVNIIYDKNKDYNPLNAIISSFEIIKNEAIFFLSVDMPMLTNHSIKSLINLYNNSPEYDIYTFKSHNGIEPMATIYKKNVLNIAKELYCKKEFKLKNFIYNFSYITLEIDNNSEFMNINRKEDYNKAIKAL